MELLLNFNYLQAINNMDILEKRNYVAAIRDFTYILVDL